MHNMVAMQLSQFARSAGCRGIIEPHNMFDDNNMRLDLSIEVINNSTIAVAGHRCLRSRHQLQVAQQTVHA